jgi:hypothetical protein
MDNYLPDVDILSISNVAVRQLLDYRNGTTLPQIVVWLIGFFDHPGGRNGLH